MKHLYTFLFFAFLPYFSIAQTYLSPDGKVPQCPGNIVTYNTNVAGGPTPSYSGCSFKWSITNGKFFLTGNSNALTTTNNSVDVIWDDVTKKGTLSVVISGCNDATINKPLTTGGVIIKSINGVNPSQVKVNGNDWILVLDDAAKNYGKP